MINFVLSHPIIVAVAIVVTVFGLLAVLAPAPLEEGQPLR